MPKKNIILLVFGLLVIAALAWFLLFSDLTGRKNFKIAPSGPTAGEEKKPTTPVAKNSGQALFSLTINQKDKTGQAIVAAETKGDIQECLILNDSVATDMCIAASARYLRNESLCAKIDDQGKTAICVDNVFYEKAIGGNKISFCLEIKESSLRQSCLINFIEQQTTPVKELDCVPLPPAEMNICLDYLKYKEDSRLFRAAARESDCQSIIGSSTKAQCLGMFGK